MKIKSWKRVSVLHVDVLQFPLLCRQRGRRCKEKPEGDWPECYIIVWKKEKELSV